MKEKRVFLVGCLIMFCFAINAEARNVKTTENATITEVQKDKMFYIAPRTSLAGESKIFDSVKAFAEGLAFIGAKYNIISTQQTFKAAWNSGGSYTSAIMVFVKPL